MNSIYDVIRPNPWLPSKGKGRGHVEGETGKKPSGMGDLYSRIRQNFTPGQNDRQGSGKHPHFDS